MTEVPQNKICSDSASLYGLTQLTLNCCDLSMSVFLTAMIQKLSWTGRAVWRLLPFVLFAKTRDPMSDLHDLSRLVSFLAGKWHIYF